MPEAVEGEGIASVKKEESEIVEKGGAEAKPEEATKKGFVEISKKKEGRSEEDVAMKEEDINAAEKTKLGGEKEKGETDAKEEGKREAMTDYEQLREDNIKRNNALYALSPCAKRDARC
eukprot:2705168-Rhodomonas_salina.1